MQIRGAEAFHIPVFVTEQYPKALGNTVPELLEVLPSACQPVAKTDFTMMVPEIQEQLKGVAHVRQIVLLGIEAHVCVLQTALDLLGEVVMPLQMLLARPFVCHACPSTCHAWAMKCSQDVVSVQKWALRCTW